MIKRLEIHVIVVKYLHLFAKFVLIFYAELSVECSL